MNGGFSTSMLVLQWEKNRMVTTKNDPQKDSENNFIPEHHPHNTRALEKFTKQEQKPKKNGKE